MKLTEVCDFQGGSQPPKEEWSFEEKDGYIRMLQIRDFTQSERVTPEYIKIRNSTKICEEDDILIARYGASIGKILTGLAGAYNVAIMRTIPDKRVLKKRYLYYYLKSPYFQNSILNVGSRAAQAGFNKEDLTRLEIECPSFDEQDTIIEVMQKVESVIELRKHELAQLDNLIKSRFVEMFGDLKTNPKGWITKSFADCYEITSSKRILKSEWKDEGIPFLRVRDMVQLATTGNMENEFFVSEEFYSTLSDSDGVPRVGDILVSATSTLGKCHVVEKGERFYFKDADVLRFRAKKEINPIYFIEQMKTRYIEEQISKTLGVTTVAHFTIKAAKTIDMRIPNIELQRKFADFVHQVDKSKLQIQKSLDDTQLLFDSLMQKYFG